MIKVKKLFMLLMLTGIVLGLFGSVSFFAMESETEIFTESHVHVNPIYANIITEEYISEVPMIFLAGENDGEEYLTTVEEVGAKIREDMVNRIEDVTVYYKAPVKDGLPWEEILDEMLLHTGNPKEGDYLKYQYGGYRASARYYIDDGYAYYTLYYTFSYYTTKEQEEIVDREVDRILGKIITKGMKDSEKVRAIYDYLCANIEYDYKNLNNPYYKLKATAYGGLINKTCVCQGYANSFYRLALEAGVDARIVTGESFGEGHAWNIVKLAGKYYNADSTWDAPRKAIGRSYEYFLKCQQHFDDHTRDYEFTSKAFNALYPMASKCWDGSILEETPGTENGPEHDSNSDGEYDVLDVLTMRGYLAGKVKLTPSQIKAGDYTGDGKITISDITKAISLFFDSIA